MLKLEDFIVDGDISVLEAMKLIDRTGQRIMFIAPDRILSAVVTDGDIRKYLIAGGNVNDPVTLAANSKPKSLPVEQRGEAIRYMNSCSIDALPILDRRGEITDIIFSNGFNVDSSKQSGIPVVIMAGGIGSRLKPYTNILPKPLIPVGEKPISEIIIDRFYEFGCREFHMIVNYKKNMIKSYFSEGDASKYSVEFTDEETFMGTGGGLCLMKGKLDGTFFFTNCDILIDADFGDIYEYHKKNGNLVTMICARKHMTVPYGVIEQDENGNISAMKEKPEFSFLTNTGVYIVESRVVDELEDGVFCGFPDIIEKYRMNGEKIGVYAISEESWTDMGQLEELEKMREKLEGTI